MVIEDLRISELRNIESIRFQASDKVNWIYGGNGAGKTSILEAVFFLARGRSFRGKKSGALVRKGQQMFNLEGLVNTSQGRRTKIACAKDSRTIRFRQDGVLVRSRRELMDSLQVRMVGENAQQLLEGDPRIRRLFLDWNLFHVEQSYGTLLHKYQRVQAQRGCWLRNGCVGRPVWDELYVSLAEEIARFREELFTELAVHCENLRKAFSVFRSLSFRFRRGWGAGVSLASLLRSSRDMDQKRGFTFYGPGRADFFVESDGLTGIRSRGQTKLLVLLLHVAAQEIWNKRTGMESVWLVDDLWSEMDQRSQDCALELLSPIKEQMFLTSVCTDTALFRGYQSLPGAMFHVEQGSLLSSGTDISANRCDFG